MNSFEKRLKRKAFKKTVQIKAAFNTYMQPFKEMPSSNNDGKKGEARITAHELFSFYTADVIKEDIVYAR
jgi:hypothetical protein